MEIYLVGGAVRDGLLGLPVKDRDYVVVGATSDDMLSRGYLPVGKDFPVFLHPVTHEQYALARTERKTAPGYHGFLFHADPSVTLDEDLARRDLTINAMAQSADGGVIDPFNGLADIEARTFRHVSPAFIEDPVRVLRLARFASRFGEFCIAPDTAELMKQMVRDGEVDALVPERVWQEFSRGLMAARPSRMLEVLRQCGAFDRVFPVLAAGWLFPATSLGDTALRSRGAWISSVLDAVSGKEVDLPSKLAILMQLAGSERVDHLPAETSAIATACVSLKVPRDCQDLAVMLGREYSVLATPASDLQAETAVGLLERCDAFRKPQRYLSLLDTMVLLGAHFMERWRTIFAAASEVDAGAIAAVVSAEHPGQSLKIQQSLRAARIEKIKIVTNITIANT